MAITEDSQVTLHFSLSVEAGDTIDSTFEREPATFCYGDGNLLPGFEQLLLGLEEGAQQTFAISPEQGFGQHNPNNIQKMPLGHFADMELHEGLVVSFADANGNELPGVISAFDDTEVVVDFNHPLAGKNLVFEVEILSITEAAVCDE